MESHTALRHPFFRAAARQRQTRNRWSAPGGAPNPRFHPTADKTQVTGGTISAGEDEDGLLELLIEEDLAALEGMEEERLTKIKR